MLTEFTARMQEGHEAANDEDGDDNSDEEPAEGAHSEEPRDTSKDNWAVVGGAQVDAIVKLAQQKGLIIIKALCIIAHMLNSTLPAKYF